MTAPRHNLILGATFLAHTVKREEDMLALMRVLYSPEDLLEALIPQLIVLVRRICRDEGISRDELAERMLGAARFFACMGVQPDIT